MGDENVVGQFAEQIVAHGWRVEVWRTVHVSFSLACEKLESLEMALSLILFYFRKVRIIFEPKVSVKLRRIEINYLQQITFVLSCELVGKP